MKTGSTIYSARNIPRLCLLLLTSGAVLCCAARVWFYTVPFAGRKTECTPVQAALDLKTALLCESDSGRVYYVYFTQAHAIRAKYVAGRFPYPSDGFTPQEWREQVGDSLIPWIGERRNGLHVGDMYLLWMPPTWIVFLDNTLQRVAVIPVEEIGNPGVTNRVEWIVTRKGMGLRPQAEADYWKRFYEFKCNPE